MTSSSDDQAQKPSLQQERSLEEQSIIQEIIERSPFKGNPTLHAEHVQKKIQEMDMDGKPDATAREWWICWPIEPGNAYVRDLSLAFKELERALGECGNVSSSNSK